MFDGERRFSLPGVPAGHGPAELDELADLPLSAIEREIETLAADINAAMCRWLLLVAEFDRRGGHEAFGQTCSATWLAWRCSVSPRAAREQLRVARALRELPRIRRAFAAGRLSYSKVRALTRVAEREMEQELVDLALEATAAQLERLLRGYRRAVADDAHARQQERRHLSTQWDEDGSLTIRGSLPAEEGALFLKALEAAREAAAATAADEAATGEEGGERERPRISSADAVVAMAESALASGVSARPGGERHQVVVHIDADAIAASGAEDDAAATGELLDGLPLPAEAARRLACDASVVALVERDGEPLSVGRKTRSIPPSIARALRRRDRGCRFPGCGRDQFVDAHHIRHWAHGGETALTNLVQLCRHHHRLLHEGGFTVEAHGNDFVFRRPSGAIVPAVPPGRRGRMTRVRRGTASASASGGWLGRRPRSAGEPMDLDLGVFALAQLHERRCRSG
jgi:hypothetical protein